MKKRLLSFALVFIMLLSLVPTGIMSASAANKTIPNLHRGVLADRESPNMVYWDAVDGVEQYEVKVILTNGTVETFYTSDSQCRWTSGREYSICSGTYSVSVTGGYEYGDRFVYETNTATINITAKHQVSGSRTVNMDASVNVVRGEDLLVTLSEDGTTTRFLAKAFYATWETEIALDEISGYPIMTLIDAPSWAMVYSSDDHKDNYLNLTPPSNCEAGTYTFYLAVATSDVDGLLITLNVVVGGYQGGENQYWMQNLTFENPTPPTYFEIWQGDPIWHEEIMEWRTKLIQGSTGNVISGTEAESKLNYHQFTIELQNADGKVMKENNVIDIGKYRYRYFVGEYPVYSSYSGKPAVFFDENMSVYLGNEKVDVVIEESQYEDTAQMYKHFELYSPWYYIYDEKPEIKSVLVNGESVADGATYVSNSKNVTVKTTYDSVLSQALQDYGCTVKYKTSLNGVDYSNVTTSTSNGNGTSTQTYVQNVNSGSSLTFKSWLEVTWPNGSKDVVDERTVTVMNVDADFESISPVPTASELNNKYTDLGTMDLGSANTNIDFKAFPKKLSAAAIEDGWTTGRSISVTRDGVEIYNRTYADNELFGWNLKENIDEGGTYLITLRVFAQKGEQIVEKTHKFRVFVKGSTIKTIALEGVGTPVIGKSPSTINTVKSNTDGVIVNKVVWTEYKQGDGGVWDWFNMSAGSKFESGKRYSVIVEFKHEDGYNFTVNKADMTVYINGQKAKVNAAYSSDAFGVTLEFDPITTPVFTTQPVGGEAPYGGKYTVNWATNFTPCKIVVGEYNSLNQVVNQVEYSNTTTSVELPANQYGYVVIAYYNDANAKYSNKITITEATPAFTMQPADCVSLGGAYAETTWATNFTPVKLALVKINLGPNGRPFYTFEELDVNATSCTVEPGFEEYCIYAYYNDTEYVYSNSFYVTEKETEAYRLGDVNNDGAIDSTDYLRIKGHFLGTYTLEGAALLAGDVNKDSAIDSTDYLRIKGHFLGTYTIEG